MTGTPSAHDDRVLRLDAAACADPELAGAKAAWLARGRHRGLPVLPGIVLTAPSSLPALRRGSEALGTRGSGGARLEVGRFPLAPGLVGQVTQAAASLGPALAVRSSSVLEGDGEWSGAFASYLEVSPSEIEKAVTGCWASAYTVANLGRFEAAGLEPAECPMAVLIQPMIRPEFGGIAHVDGRGVVEVIGIKGSPAPLVQGWESGVRAMAHPGGEISENEQVMGYFGEGIVAEVAHQLRAAHRATGADSAEWGYSGGNLHIFQLGKRAVAAPALAPPPRLTDRRLIGLARLAGRYPGPLGEALVLAWGAGHPAAVMEAAASETPDSLDETSDPVTLLDHAVREAGALTAEAWRMPESAAASHAAAVLRQARGTDPARALDLLSSLPRPDPVGAARVLQLLAGVQRFVEPASPGGSGWFWHLPLDDLAIILRGGPEIGPGDPAIRRPGMDRWEPFQAAVVKSFGTEHQGVAASPGSGCGRLCFITEPGQAGDFRPRDVIVAPNPVPNLAPLLWNSAGLVTTAGSPAAHLFEAARSLRVPAVCSIDLTPSLGVEPAAATGRFMVAVDGDGGLVHTSDW